MKKSPTTKKRPQHKRQLFPRGWNENRVKDVIAYYDRQTDEEGAAEYEAAMKIQDQTMMLVPIELVPEIRRLIARRRGA